MLPWWRIMTSKAMQIPHTLPAATGSGSGANPAYRASSPAAASEEPATHRVRHSNSPNTTSMPRANHGNTASMAPNEVATPLPPRPRRNGERTCPRTVARPTTYAVRRSKSNNARNVGTNPLRTSSRPTTTPHRNPRTRLTFVAPGFPEPCRRSAWRVLAMMVAGLIDPTKNPSTAAIPTTIQDSDTFRPGRVPVEARLPPRWFPGRRVRPPQLRAQPESPLSKTGP